MGTLECGVSAEPPQEEISRTIGVPKDHSLAKVMLIIVAIGENMLQKKENFISTETIDLPHFACPGRKRGASSLAEPREQTQEPVGLMIEATCHPRPDLMKNRWTLPYVSVGYCMDRNLKLKGYTNKSVCLSFSCISPFSTYRVKA